MKRTALDWFVCPISKGPLSARSFDEIETDGVIKAGVLTCETSNTWFPIINGMPILLDFVTDIQRQFRDRYQQAHGDFFAKYQLPNGNPRPGEECTQRTFTKEWESLNDDDTSFGLTPEQRDQFIRLELDWPSTVLIREHLSVLEVGCGSGFESMSLERVTHGTVVGIDLNLWLIRCGPIIDQHPKIHLAVASAFAIPARERFYDVVYSSGTLHHTYSTKAAFENVAKHRRDDGMIYIWVYALEDSAGSKYMRAEWSWEEIVRPRIAKLPSPLQSAVVSLGAAYMTWWYRRNGAYSKDKWTKRNSEHAVRDRWTPLFAHRQSFHEVIIWMREQGLDYRLVDPHRYLEVMKAPLFGIGIRGAHPETSNSPCERH